MHLGIVGHAVVGTAFDDAVTQEVELHGVKAIRAVLQVVVVDALLRTRMCRIDGIGSVDCP